MTAPERQAEQSDLDLNPIGKCFPSARTCPTARTDHPSRSTDVSA